MDGWHHRKQHLQPDTSMFPLSRGCACICNVLLVRNKSCWSKYEDTFITELFPHLQEVIMLNFPCGPRCTERLAKPSFKLRSHWLTRYQGHNYSPSMSPRVNSSPSSAKVGSMLSMVEMYSPVSIVSFRPSAPRLSPQGRGRGENTQDRWAVLWRSATPTTPATNREDNSCSQRPWDKADASREADDDVDKPVHADVRLSRRHLVLRWLRHSQTDSEAEGGRSLVEAKLLLSWDQSSSSNERVAFAVVW